LSEELREIRQAWESHSNVEVVLLEKVTISTLREALLERAFQVVHFGGHGSFNSSTGESGLEFEGKNDRRDLVAGTRLAAILKDSAVQLVVLNASWSARGSIPASLILAGIPAVVAMQFTISDRPAVTFSRYLYRRLAVGDSIEAAVVEGRLAVYSARTSALDWAGPALFTSESASPLFGGHSESRSPYDEPKPHPTVAQRSIVGQLIGASSDKIADEDRLGFSHYVRAFADLIESTHTHLPLTVGIFGSWGMGKSFLLEHIERELNERREERQRSASLTAQGAAVSRIHIVTFNAWEYNASEAIWPGLVRKIMDRLEKEISWPFPGRFLTKFWLNLRAQLRKENVRIGAALFIVALAASAGILLWSGKLSQNWKALLVAGVAGFAGGLLKLVSDTVANPLSQWLTKLFLEDDYGRHIGHLARIRKDLEFLERRLRTNPEKLERVLILIDDLDRCEPEKAVEMLQAVKLLLDFESFVLFLGIDARIITKAIEKHYQGLLGEAGASGYEYLDKIVQIPFQIPAPSTDQVREFLRSQMGDPQPAEEEPPVDVAPRPAASSPEVGRPAEATEVPAPVPEVAPAAPREEPSAGLSAFTYEELLAFQNLAACLRPNPRHLKRLVNIYRLVRTLAHLTDERVLLERPGATICWVVLCAQWPHTAHGMMRRLDEKHSEMQRGEDSPWPETDPLRYLLAETEKALAAGPSRRPDPEISLLHRLVECDEARMSWKELWSIRRYTIHFNPTPEIEDDDARPIEGQGGTEGAPAEPLSA
jgi:hypothetical protein